MGQSNDAVQPLPNTNDIRAVVVFIDVFNSPDFSFGRFEGGDRREDGTITMPYFVESDNARRFIQALHKHGFIRPFNWPDWQNEAQRYLEQPEALNTADLETICKLFTTHVRKERFCEGHLASMFECGHIVHLLHRLRVIIKHD